VTPLEAKDSESAKQARVTPQFILAMSFKLLTATGGARPFRRHVLPATAATASSAALRVQAMTVPIGSQQRCAFRQRPRNPGPIDCCDSAAELDAFGGWAAVGALQLNA